ncbi:fimbrillin family protein [Bacteroides ndongoniae]|uniref:fimbrillin family protein n=1 Tax=Bacteroides ndongoniae TaxID=1903262 RepID=UPI00135655DC|nr:hypothetical protein [Bacteroides ndongoniae]
MMKGKNFYTILLCAALMVAGTAACSDDWLSGADTSHDSSEEGQVAAVKLEGNGEVVSRSAFQAGTAYRLVMFTRGFEATDTSAPDLSEDSVLRYNGLATETALGTFQYLVVNDDRHINNDWFSFRSLEPIDDATKTETGRRSLSFYGFTYGEENAPELDTDAYTRTEEVDGNGELKDLMWGILVDQNDATAEFPCEIPFRHAFSRLEFKVSQLESETEAGQGMYNLGIERIAVTDTYQSGTVDLFTGKTTLNGAQSERPLSNMATNYNVGEYISVDTPDSLGAMIVFPSAKESLSDGVDKYTIGLKITLKGTLNEVEKLVGTGNATKSSSGDYYTGEYIVKQVYSSVYGGNDLTSDGSIAASPLYLQAGSKYTLHIVLMKDEVRVVTVVPSKVEWLPGETDDEGNTFSTEVVGQPIFFDNTMWMDRNLGANEADPGGNYNQTIGYYYQNNRNIPYWPYSTERFGYSYYPNQLNSIPKPENRYLDTFTFSSWENPSFKVYPMIDENIMKGDSYKYYWNSNASKLFYKLPSATENPNAKSYIFYWGKGSADVPLDWTTNNSWTKRENQPAPPGYALPTQEQFQSVFPTTVFAGNITFCKLNKSDSDWYGDQTMTEDIIRICVPFYTDGVNTTNKLKYLQLWKNLKDPGASPNRNSYYNGWYDPHFYINSEPDGDPSPGYCSVYIISRKGDDLYTLSIADDIEKYYQTLQWGTIYGIKKVGTSEAYRMRWKVMNAQTISGGIPLLYVKVSMYSCTKNDNLTADNYDSYDWDHPSSEMFFPLCGEVEGRNATQSRVSGFSSYGSAVLYACASNNAALHIKITGSNKANQYMSVVSNEVQTNAKQIRLVKTQN